MYNCDKCNKTFKYESDYNKHKNRKTSCVKKEILKCDLCNVTFTCPYNKKIHENTKKHIINYNIHINGNNNINVNGDVENSFNNIIYLTLNTNSFKDTDLTYINFGLIKDIGDYIYVNTISNKNMSKIKKIIILFDEVINILQKLHFNIGIEENQNLKILLVFPGLKNNIYEYLILEIEQTTKKITWKSINYETLLNNILDHLLLINDRFKHENYIKFVNYLREQLLNNKTIEEELQPIINDKLSKMYINFNKEQKKPERDIKFLFNEKLQEYSNYRTNECTLVNGFIPKIENSQFK